MNKLTIIVGVGATLIAGAIVATNRYQIAVNQTGAFRLNTLNGEVSICVAQPYEVVEGGVGNDRLSERMKVVCRSDWEGKP
jgi:hypothetical protein